MMEQHILYRRMGSSGDGGQRWSTSDFAGDGHRSWLVSFFSGGGDHVVTLLISPARPQTGFTLVELLVVITIIGI